MHNKIVTVQEREKQVRWYTEQDERIMNWL
jgi:hypothetical protein